MNKNKFKLATPPKYWNSIKNESLRNQAKIVGEINKNNAESIGGSITKYFSSFKYDYIKDQNLVNQMAAALASAFRNCVDLLSSEWNSKWLNQINSNPENALQRLVNNSHSYVIGIHSILIDDYQNNTKISETIFSSILEGKLTLGHRDCILPMAPEESFLFINDFLQKPHDGLTQLEQEIKQIESKGEYRYFDPKTYQSFLQQWQEELPVEYLEFLQTEDHLPEEEERFFWVEPDDWGTDWDRILLMQEFEMSSSLMQAFDPKGFTPIPRMLPMGDDGSMGFVLMSFREGEKGAIYFSMPYSQVGGREKNTESHQGMGYWKIANSFPEFLSGLEESPDEE